MDSWASLASPVVLGCAFAALALPGCASEVSFDSPDSSARIRALHNAAEAGDTSSIPQIITMLDSDDPAVRMLSIRTLERMTGQTLGYDYAAPEYERRPAVERWVAWNQARTTASSRP